MWLAGKTKKLLDEEIIVERAPGRGVPSQQIEKVRFELVMFVCRYRRPRA